MNTIPRFYVEQRGDQIKMIFPLPQRYELRTYQKSARRTYTRMEPVQTPWLSLPIGRETANRLAAALKANRVRGDVIVYPNGDVWMSVCGMEVTTL